MKFRQFVTSRPFLIVIGLAILLRLLAVIFSQGYMAHDDHFETIEIATSWQHEGIFLPDGTLRWEGKPDIGVMRSAVYNLFLLGLMQLTSAVGVVNLDIHMYFNRFVHALLSLLPVIFGYRYLKEETNDRVALVGGLMLAGHFLMPYLGVRNLVEMVSADFLFPCLYYATRSMKRQSNSDAILAGVLGGLAFMIRVQVAAALVVVPIAMAVRLYGKSTGIPLRGVGYPDSTMVTPQAAGHPCIAWRSPRQGVAFAATFLLMVALQGLLDVFTHGKFLGSITNIVDNLGAPPTLPGPWYRYILLILGMMIPPFSLLFIGSLFQKKIVRNHLLLWSAAIAFVVGHSLIANKQERFIIPVFPVLIVLGCVGLYYFYQSNGWFVRWRKLRIGLWWWLAAVNAVLLVAFTFNYSHRGAIDPLVYLSRQPDVRKVLFDCSERSIFVPHSYWQYDRTSSITIRDERGVQQAVASGELQPADPPNYIVIFTDQQLDRHLRMLGGVLGRYEIVYHGKPSVVDITLNKLNPKYNRRNESWVVRRIS
jgi:hypothetical protein